MADTNDNKNSGVNTRFILYVGLVAVAYYGIVRPLTNKLGLTKSNEDKERDRDIDLAVKAKGWAPTFYKQYMTANPKQTFCLKKSADLDALAKQINSAWGYFNDDENAIFAALRQLRSQVQLSQLCERYNTNYKTDLLTRLKNPWYKGNDGLEPQEFIEVAKIVNVLPENVSTC